jgi:hypothetical protein
VNLNVPWRTAHIDHFGIQILIYFELAVDEMQVVLECLFEAE